MEDFGTILWIVAAVGIMAANLFSKSRKARGKGSSHSGEAWPSMEEAPRREGHSDIGGTGGTLRRAAPERLPREILEPHDPREIRKPREIREPAGWPEIPGFPKIPPVAKRPEGPVTAAAPRKEAFSADSRHGSPADGRKAGMDAQREIGAGNEPKTVPAVLTGAAETAEGPEEGIGGGEFDLRRAVIYSEILKPKFEE